MLKIILRLLWHCTKWISCWFGRNWISLAILYLLINHIFQSSYEHNIINENVVNGYTNIANALTEFYRKHFPLL
jgi:hypothetical protein